jgi:hypothetical protein
MPSRLCFEGETMILALLAILLALLLAALLDL